MIIYLEKPYKSEEVEKILNPLVREWFFNKFKEFSLTQLYGVLEIHDKNNILVSAVTGSGKTITAFLSIINELVTLSENNILEDKVYCVYVSPLKALANDVTKNLVEPLNEIKEIAKKYGKEINIRVALRTGDTTASERQKILRKPPHILVTTSESLALMLSSYKFVDYLRDVQWFIMDELHAFAENKRGTHLSLSLERLQDLSSNMIRIGLSATCEPIDSLAQFLVGINRDCKIAKVDLIKKFDFKVISPTKDLIDVNYEHMHNALYNQIDNLIQEHKTTLIFTNTRSGTERVVHHLKEKFPKKYTENIGAHHGSLSKKHRFDIEERLRKGELKVIVCSTSLELGIDIGYVDLVICLGSPKSVARATQRFGRSGHALHDTVKGRLIVLDRDDLVECSVLLKSALEKKIDKIHIPENCLDVLAQQIDGMAIQRRWNIKEMYDLIKRSYCYRNLKYEDFYEIIQYLAGEFVSLEDRYIYAKIWYDPETKQIGKRGRLGRVIYMTNIGTIPEESHVIVKIKELPIGTIDEAFLERLKRGDIFVLGGNTYEFLFSRGMVAQVRSAGGKSPTVPSWFSEMLPLSFDLALDIQKFRRYIDDMFVNKKKKEEIVDWINKYLYLDENAAEAIYRYFHEQYLYSVIPNDKRLTIEYYTGEEGKKYVIFHSLFGRRVNDVLSRALAFIVGRLQHRDVEIGINDNGFYLSSHKPIQALRALELLLKNDLNEVMDHAIEKTEILKRRFRHCAARALMILREYKGKRKRVGRQQVSSMILMNAVKRINPNFCILKEARREVLEDLMDIENTKKVLEWTKENKIEIKQVNHEVPSPFAFSLITQGYSDVMRIEDKIEFIRRMHKEVMERIGEKIES
ncbi:MAG: ATP-dependent helicase [Nanoarchaeota archaeon]